MIEFVTVFLGLVTGVHPVVLSVSPEVATLEVRLDGEVVEVLREEPWTFDCDSDSPSRPMSWRSSRGMKQGASFIGSRNGSI